MSKDKNEPPDFEEMAVRLLAELPGCEWPGVTKVVDGRGVVFEIAVGVRPSHIQGLLILDLKYVAPRVLAMFYDLAEDFDIPRDEWTAYAEDGATVMIVSLLQRAQETLADALTAMVEESFITWAQIASVPPSEEWPPVLSRESIKAAASSAAQAAKRRLQARRPGRERGVEFVNVCTAVLRRGGEDAQAQDVARDLGITERQLYNIQRGAGYSGPGGWRDFTGYVARLLDRK